jgi:hypothetical protein
MWIKRICCISDSEGEIVEPVGVQQDLLADTQQFFDAHAPSLR